MQLVLIEMIAEPAICKLEDNFFVDNVSPE